MCGRFTLTTPTAELAAQFEVPDPPILAAHYNIAPSQVIAVVGLKPDGVKRGLALLKWGLVPSPDRVRALYRQVARTDCGRTPAPNFSTDCEGTRAPVGIALTAGPR